jgi:hypothetical protein
MGFPPSARLKSSSANSTVRYTPPPATAQRSWLEPLRLPNGHDLRAGGSFDNPGPLRAAPVHRDQRDRGVGYLRGIGAWGSA